MIHFVTKLVFVLSLSTLSSLAQETFLQSNLPFKEGTIHYKITGNEKGIETLYLKNFGEERAKYRESQSKVMSETTNNKTVEFMTPETIYLIDLTQKTGKKTTNPKHYFLEEYNKLNKKEKQNVKKNIKTHEYSLFRLEQSDIVKNSEKLLGFECDKSSVKGTSLLTISNTDIVLKSEASIMGFHTETVAVEIEQGEVNDTLFKMPQDITIILDEEAEKKQKAMIDKLLSELKSPKKNTAASPSRIEDFQLQTKQKKLTNPEEIHNIMKENSVEQAVQN